MNEFPYAIIEQKKHMTIISPRFQHLKKNHLTIQKNTDFMSESDVHVAYRRSNSVTSMMLSCLQKEDCPGYSCENSLWANMEG